VSVFCFKALGSGTLEQEVQRKVFNVKSHRGYKIMFKSWDYNRESYYALTRA